MTDHGDNERMFVAEKLAELRAKHSEGYVEAALQSAADSLKAEKVEYEGAEYLRVYGSVGINGKVIEIEEMGRISRGRKIVEASLRERGARLIVFLEEGLIEPPVPA